MILSEIKRRIVHQIEQALVGEWHDAFAPNMAAGLPWPSRVVDVPYSENGYLCCLLAQPSDLLASPSSASCARLRNTIDMSSSSDRYRNYVLATTAPRGPSESS